MSREQAVSELQRRAGTQFDPEVVDALLDLLGHAAPQVPDRARAMPPSPRARGR
jgi:HD-GYP domain-containing protein (c-di-GMP phosphodiesterase class II)